VLDQRHGESGQGRQDQAHRLRQDDVAIGLQPGQPEAGRRLPLAACDAHDPASEDLGRERRLEQRQAKNGGPVAVEPDQWRQDEIDDVELHQERRVADQLDIDGGRGPPDRRAGQPEHRDRDAEHDGQHEGDGRKPDRLDEAQRQRDEADILKKRIQGIDCDADAFTERVTLLVKRLAEKDLATSPEEASLVLNAKLTEAREAQSRHTELQRQLDAAHIEHAAARKRLEDATTRMQSLCREARCAAPAMLPEIENRSRQRRLLMEESRALESRLRRLSAGATVEAFVTEAEAIAPDSLAPEMERLAEDITALERERSELDQTIGTEKAELKRMDGRAEAAGHAEDAERLLARLESDVAQYARTKIASAILTRTIERYREKHQGPLIKRASQLFARMTRNAFQGVRAEYDGKGNPILVGIRSGGDEAVTVDGMSDGTADQLYLALRLASLEHYLENSEPLPFVVDDILLRFDDERALATLEVLVDLSEKTQVIFFTHHHHLVELAHSAIGAAKLTTHLLNDSPAVAHN